MPCKKCGRTYTGLVCDCFQERAAKEAAELQLRRFKAREITGYLFNGHVFLEATKTPALCGLELKRSAVGVKNFSMGSTDIVDCAECRAAMGAA